METNTITIKSNRRTDKRSLIITCHSIITGYIICSKKTVKKFFDRDLKL